LTALRQQSITDVSAVAEGVVAGSSMVHHLVCVSVQDFGARDPTPGELGSNFGEKIVMNWDTEHIIK
jgi:4a-hydroxytetrahydrobiopterin dehydratase